jgi:putative FmdB family regulatory protein
MPIYEYECTGCACRFEHLVFKADEAPPRCPACCGTQVVKVMSAASFRPQGIPTGSGGFKAPSCKPAGGG